MYNNINYSLTIVFKKNNDLEKSLTITERSGIGAIFGLFTDGLIILFSSSPKSINNKINPTHTRTNESIKLSSITAQKYKPSIIPL